MKLERKLIKPEDNDMISVKVKGDWEKTTNWLDKIISRHNFKVMEKYGREGVAALSAATPVDTGLTASSWDYRIDQTDTSISLVFVNNNKTKTNIPIAILLQYGHGNGRGGYVQGRDFINPAVQPVFDKLVEDLWKEVIVQ